MNPSGRGIGMPGKGAGAGACETAFGTVIGFEDDHIRVKKDATDNVVVVGRETWNKYRYVYDYATRKVEGDIVGTFE